jgi:cytochrome P450 family 6
MYELSCRYTTDSISNVAFGLDSNSLNDEDSEMRKYGKEIIEFGPAEFLKFFFTTSFPNFARKIHMTANKKFIIDYFYNTFKYNFELREKGKIVRNDFVQLLLELKQKNSLTIQDIAAEAFIFFLGGFDTSSNLISFVLFELANNQDVQKRLRDEIFDAVNENGGKFTYEMIFEMKYLEMVIKETLRKFPPAFNVLRRSKNEFKIPNTNLMIPGDTDIHVSVYSLHRDPEYFPNPEKFDPERFSPENIEKIKPFTFIPFGFGQRACIGKRYASMKTKIGIAKLVLNFEIFRCEKTPDEPVEYKKTGLFLNSANKMWLKMKKLNNNV